MFKWNSGELGRKKAVCRVVGRVAVGRVFIRALPFFLSLSFRQGTIILSEGQTVEVLGPSKVRFRKTGSIG
jgi:hypothetical protein